MSKRLHVVPGNDGWNVQREGASRASSTYKTQDAAIRAAAQTAKQEKGEVIIHRPDGRIRDADSYGNDPCPPKDTKH